ncbi:MAG: hypothetical protein L6Q95_19550, partial [Planctomycetes bacterium]|nr:hypothetical protein [Planctomycetota bacterium]
AAQRWRAVGDAKGAARGDVDILLFVWFHGERLVASGELRDGGFAVDLPLLHETLPAVLRGAELIARIDAPGFLPARATVPLEGREPGDVRLDVRLKPGACVRGRVVDDAGRPVEHAEIRVSPWQSGMSTESDRHGRFAIPVENTVECWLCACRPDLGVAVKGPLRLTPLADADTGDLLLMGPAVLSGIAVYPDGTPVRQLVLNAVPGARRGEESPLPEPRFDAAENPVAGLAWGSTVTDGDGRFLFRGLLPGSYFLLEDKTRRLLETGTDVRVVLDLHRILVRVVDERGVPAEVEASARCDSGDVITGKIDDVEARPGERWTVTIGDRDLQPAAATVDVTAERREYEVTLVARAPTGFGRAQVTLLDPLGTPFPDVIVSLDALPGETAMLFRERLDSDGRTRQVPACRYRLVAQPADLLAFFLPAETEAELRAGAVTPVRLEARAGGRVQVTPRRADGAADEELEDVRVEARMTQGGEAVGLTRLLVQGTGYSLGGEWRLGESAWGHLVLEPGPYEIRVEAAGYRPLALPALVRAGEVTAIEAVLVPEGR